MHSQNTPPSSFHSTAAALARAGSDVMALPFDLARDSYARAVRAGLIERSMLQSAHFARALRAVENLTLGVWARRS